MLGQAEDVDRLPILVEVAANAGEGARTVLDGVGADADLGVGKGNDLSLEVGVFQHRARAGHETISCHVVISLIFAYEYRTASVQFEVFEALRVLAVAWISLSALFGPLSHHRLELEVADL